MANPEHVEIVRQGAEAIAKESVEGVVMGSFEQLYKEVIDYLAPLQTMPEHAVYHVLIRLSHVEGKGEVRIGHRALARLLPIPAKAGTTNKGTQVRRSSQAHVKEVLEKLAQKGHIVMGDTTFEGTLYTIRLPREIPECAAQIKYQEARLKASAAQDDFYNVPGNRIKVFERDGNECRYCGARVTVDDATLDHVRPISEGGTHSLSNLVTCCLKCNSIKAGRKPDDCVLDLLERYKSIIRQNRGS